MNYIFYRGLSNLFHQNTLGFACVASVKEVKNLVCNVKDYFGATTDTKNDLKKRIFTTIACTTVISGIAFAIISILRGVRPAYAHDTLLELVGPNLDNIDRAVDVLWDAGFRY